MQKIEIIFDEVLERQVLMLLRQTGIEDYTRFDLVKGVGGGGRQKKFNDAIGPGVNSLVFTVVEDDKAERLVRGFRRFKEVQGEHAGAQLCVSAVSQFV